MVEITDTIYMAVRQHPTGSWSLDPDLWGYCAASCRDTIKRKRAQEGKLANIDDASRGPVVSVLKVTMTAELPQLDSIQAAKVGGAR